MHSFSCIAYPSQTVTTKEGTGIPDPTKLFMSTRYCELCAKDTVENIHQPPKQNKPPKCIHMVWLLLAEGNVVLQCVFDSDFLSVKRDQTLN